MVLNSIGLRLTAKASQGRIPRTSSCKHTKKHTLSIDAVTEMRELLALKEGDAANAGKWAPLLQSAPETCGIVKGETSEL